MTKRLEDALRQLPPDAVEQVADFAEFLARRCTSTVPQKLKLDWVGAAADAYPEHTSGVDAARAAGQLMGEAVERSLEK